jgi:hypothetical protein
LIILTNVKLDLQDRKKYDSIEVCIINILLGILYIVHNARGIRGRRVSYSLSCLIINLTFPLSTDEALTPKSQRDNCYISAGGNAGTHRVCPEALKVATLPLDCHSLG